MKHHMHESHKHGSIDNHEYCTCPQCGYSRTTKSRHHEKMLAKKAWQHSLMHKIKDELEKRHNDKLNEMAKNIVDMTDAKMKMKADIWKKKQAIKEIFWDIFEEE